MGSALQGLLGLVAVGCALAAASEPLGPWHRVVVALALCWTTALAVAAYTPDAVDAAAFLATGPVVVGLVGLSMPAAERSRRARQVTAALAAVTYPFAILVGIFTPVGVLVLLLAGGEPGVDGLQVVPAGVAAGLGFGLLAHVWARHQGPQTHPALDPTLSGSESDGGTAASVVRSI